MGMLYELDDIEKRALVMEIKPEIDPVDEARELLSGPLGYKIPEVAEMAINSLIARIEAQEEDIRFLGDRLEVQADVMSKVVVERDALREAREWQPIETAPLDVSVLIFIPSPVAEHYGPAIYRGLCVDRIDGRRVWKVTGLHFGSDCGAEYWPSLWMPLPDAPKGEQK